MNVEDEAADELEVGEAEGRGERAFAVWFSEGDEGKGGDEEYAKGRTDDEK